MNDTGWFNGKGMIYEEVVFPGFGGGYIYDSKKKWSCHETKSRVPPCFFLWNRESCDFMTNDEDTFVTRQPSSSSSSLSSSSSSSSLSTSGVKPKSTQQGNIIEKYGEYGDHMLTSPLFLSLVRPRVESVILLYRSPFYVPSSHYFLNGSRRLIFQPCFQLWSWKKKRIKEMILHVLSPLHQMTINSL